MILYVSCPLKARIYVLFRKVLLLRVYIYSGKIYVITKHYKNGMCNMYCPDMKTNENWNACNNAHFIYADYVSLGIRSLL